MLVFREWLNEYTDVTIDSDQFCERMVMSGSNIETADRYGEGIKNIVVGKILNLEKHPDADKLLVCMLDVGQDEPVQIVTGATNVFVGAFVPVILHGGRLPNGQIIKKGKLRGVESFGMLCSAKELGYEDKVIPTAHKDGIWILDRDYTLGQDIVEALELAGEVVDFEITPNRPDCLSMIGMARETAATFKGSLRYPDSNCKKEKGQAQDYIDVQINKPELCNRYVARVITDVKIGPSPWWLQKRLMYAGMRPINNMVDITNYVMLEYGQPLHAFDIQNIKGNKIIVDTAKDGEVFITLDGTERKLFEGMLLIKDQERPVAIAGVMGGLNSEIQQDTTTIIIESANFNGDSIRTTSKKLGLRTEASSRFEKGIDSNLAEVAADRVCRLAELLEAGTVVGGRVDSYPIQREVKPVAVRANRVNQVLGTNIPQSEMEDIFTRLEMKVDSKDGIMLVSPPTIRQDLELEVDFIEEAARMFGYDQMPVTIPKGNNQSQKSEALILRDMTREALVGMGASEIQTYSFVSPKGLDQIKIAEDSQMRDGIRLINPLGEENSMMRTSLLPNMLEVLERNFSRNIPAVKAFEIGNIFLNIEGELGLPIEKEGLCIACYGEEQSFFTLKGMVDEMLFKVGIRDLQYVSEMSLETYHPGRCAKIYYQEKELGIIGELHPDVSEQYNIDTRVYCCTLDFQKVVELADRERHYVPLPKYPAMSRDIALLVDEEIKVADIEAIIKYKASPLLESVVLFDVYRGKQIPQSQKSVAFSLTYRAIDRTLTDEEVVEVHDRVLLELKEKLNAALREI
ncbi:MAG: phenylalanine--tRNA ligase subunit beta [Eubacteriales bacterium]|nr:phenylalanine--tRNA ligase subunit beta [Eubacteriales bacterium]